MKKIAILGGGFTGLAAAYYLREQGHSVTLFEKDTYLGGLAQGFRADGWDWSLERAYHHLFKNDTDIQSFAKDIGFEGIYFSTPQTNSLYKDGDNYRIIPVDSPQDFMQFPLLNTAEKIRGAAILAFLKISPFLRFFESMSAQEFGGKYMGRRMWDVFFSQLFRKKFGKYAGKILLSFLWARIHKRTKELGYVKGGFQELIDAVERTLVDVGCDIRKGVEVSAVCKKNGTFMIGEESFDIVISTLPSLLLPKVAGLVLPESYLDGIQKLKYLHALVLILVTKNKILDETYWLNIAVEDIPMMFVGQHTNFVDARHYGGNHLAYIGYYLERDDPLMKMSEGELRDYLLPYLEVISGQKIEVLQSYSFKGPFAQPIFDKEFILHKPNFRTPVEGFYVANLDMTYPYDRGTNYAVKLGKDVAGIISDDYEGGS